MYTVFYLIQIGFLIACIPLLVFCVFMVNRSRLALNGLYRGLVLLLSMLIALIVLLIVRRVDDMLGILDSATILFLSSAVMLLVVSMVVVVTLDLYFLYRNRALYAMWQAARQKRIDDLEAAYQKSERTNGAWSA